METGTKTPVYENQQLSDGCRFEIQRSTMIGDESICPEVEAIEAPCANLLMTKKAAVTGEGYIFNNWLPSNYSSDPKKTFSRRILGYRWSYLRDAYSKSFRSLLRQNRFKNGVWVTNRFSNNYYHWLCKELPKVYLLEQSGFDYELFLPAEIARLEFARKSLEAIGVTEYQTVDFGSAALVEKLYTVDFFGNTKYPDPNVISALQETILRNFEPERSHDGPTRVFISRQSATKRRILNQSDVDDVLNR